MLLCEIGPGCRGSRRGTENALWGGNDSPGWTRRGAITWVHTPGYVLRVGRAASRVSTQPSGRPVAKCANYLRLDDTGRILIPNAPSIGSSFRPGEPHDLASIFDALSLDSRRLRLEAEP